MSVPYPEDLWIDLNPSLMTLGHGATVTTGDLTDSSVPGRAGTARTPTIVGSTVTCQVNGLNNKRTILCNGGNIVLPQVDSALNAGYTIIIVWRITLDGEDPFFNGSATVWIKNATVTPQSWQNDGYTFGISPNQAAAPWHIATLSGGTDTTPLFAGSTYKRRTSLDSEAAVFFDEKGPVVGNTISIPRYGYAGLARLLIYRRHLKFSEECEAVGYVSTEHGVWSPVTGGQVGLINAGTSTTANGAGGRAVARSLSALGPLEYTEAVSGSNSTAWVNRTEENLDAVNAMVSNGLIPLVTAHPGANDVDETGVINAVSDPDGPVQALADAGARVLLLTMSQWSNSPSLGVPRSDKETYRQAIRTWMLANWKSKARGIYDLGATAQFGIATLDGSTPANASILVYPGYFDDNVHLTETGHGVRAALIKEIQLAILGGVTADVSTPGTVTLTHSYVPAGHTIQWYESSASGSLGTAIPGATTNNYAHSGATPGVPAYYTALIESDTPVYAGALSPQVAATVTAAGGDDYDLTLLGCGA